MVTLEKNDQNAITFVSKFIENQWQDDSNRYIGIGFDDGAFDKSTLKRYCLEEQRYVCCYCSRELDNSRDTQLEHIIPRARNVDNEELQRYFRYSVILSQNIILQDEFCDFNSKKNTPPFPHHIAYQNIVASCNGKTINSSEDPTCCNRNRSNDFVPPFNLMVKSISYLNDGTVYYVDDEMDNRYINSLNLNKDLLRSIRRIWFLFASSDVTEDELIHTDSEEKIVEVITLYLEANSFKLLTDRRIIDSFKILSNWGTLMKYRYFLNYFRTNQN